MSSNQKNTTNKPSGSQPIAPPVSNVAATTLSTPGGSLLPSDMIENVIGFVERIETPFGELCSASFDGSSNGRLYKPIEDSIAKLRANLSPDDSNASSTTFNANYAQSLLDYSTNSILEFFGTTSKTHFLEDCGSHEISPYLHLARTLCAANGAFAPSHAKIYVTSSESYFNILSWKDSGFKDISAIDVNTESEINIDTLTDRITKAATTQGSADAHLISISSSSSVTGQRIPNLAEVFEAIAKLRESLVLRRKSIRVLIALNVTAIASHEILNIASKTYAPVDFFILHASKFIGSGVDSANLLISRKDTSNNNNNVLSTALANAPTTNSITQNNNTIEGRSLLEALTNNNGSSSSAAASSDPVRLYRTAMALQLLSSLKVEKIAEIEKNHMLAFLTEIAAANKDLKKANLLRSINVWGCSATAANASASDLSMQNMQYGQVYLNVYTPGSEAFDAQNRSHIHPELVAQILHDLFGIIVTFKASFALPDSQADNTNTKSKGNNSNRNANPPMVLLNVPKNVIDEQFLSKTTADAVVGCVSVEISFLHSIEEVMYVAKALRMLAEKGEEFQRFYDKKTFAMNHYTHDVYDFNLASISASNFGKNSAQRQAELIKSRNTKYEAQMTNAKAVFKNYQRYFSLHDGYTKEKTEQIRKNPPAGAMPPLLPPKSFVKLPDDATVQSEDTLLSVTDATSKEEAQQLVKQELARIMELRNAKRLSKSIQSAEIDQINRLKQQATQSQQDLDQLEGQLNVGIAKINNLELKSEMEKHMKNMINVSLQEQKKGEKANIEAMIAAMRKEMEEKLAQANAYKEQFVFEDLKPSVMFKNVLDHREKRHKHLRLIFNAYAKLNQSQQQIESKLKKGGGNSAANPNNGGGYIDAASNKLVIRRGDASRAMAAFTINLQQYLQFCGEFHLLTPQVDASVVSQIYNRTINQSSNAMPSITDIVGNGVSSTNSIGGSSNSSSSEMNFNEFVASLEKLSLVFFYDNHLLLTSFDKMEALYQFMSIDDMKALKVKLKNVEELAQNIMLPINLSRQKANLAIKSQSVASIIHPQNANNSNNAIDSQSIAAAHAKTNLISYLDHDFLKNNVRNNSISNGINIPHYSPPPLPASFSQKNDINSNGGTTLMRRQPAMKSEGRINWIKNEYLATPLFKNESNFLNHDYAEQSSSHGMGLKQVQEPILPNHSSVSKLQQSHLFQPNSNSNYSPLKNNSDIFQSHLYSSNSYGSQQHPNYQASQQAIGSTMQQMQKPQINSTLNRVKQIEDTEAQRQKDLFLFIQNNQSNRYNQPKKKQQ